MGQGGGDIVLARILEKLNVTKMILEGIKVVEMSAYVVASSTGVILSDFGADVVKIEPPTGDPLRALDQTEGFSLADFNFIFEFLNRNKRSMAIDATKPGGREIILKLVQQSDIFLTNYRPAALEKLGLTYEEVVEINPRLIYVHITGYGPEGPGKNQPAFDETGFWARSGIMGILGEPDTPCPPLRGAMGDLTTALSAFGGLMLALYERERTGKGQKVDLSLISSGAWVAGWDLQASLHTGRDVPRQSRHNQPNPLYNTYETKDKRWVQINMLQTDRYWPGLCKALGREDLIDDLRFNTHAKRCENNEELILLIDEMMAHRTLKDIETTFNREGLVWAGAQTFTEVIADPQVAANNYLVQYEHPSLGLFRSINSPIRLSAEGQKKAGAAPEFGQHTEEVLLELGYDWNGITSLKDNGIVI